MVREAGYCVVVHATLCSVQHIFSRRQCGHKCKIRLSCVLNTALDLAAAALRSAWRVRGSYVGEIKCEGCDKQRRFFEYGLCLGSRRGGRLGVG